MFFRSFCFHFFNKKITYWAQLLHLHRTPAGGRHGRRFDAAALVTQQHERHCFLEITWWLTSETQLRERLGSSPVSVDEQTGRL